MARIFQGNSLLHFSQPCSFEVACINQGWKLTAGLKGVTTVACLWSALCTGASNFKTLEKLAGWQKKKKKTTTLD